ncbi:Coiled-coil domain-containing protein 24 [Labeo rohita]|uniref:Coiled-coil domain-containing protein 24 n=1 Tax=Labeo rohita TaxID=84645 RepID=A0ABQ8MXW6_LABRO|nr:Coiled-coil domain-containing protein 24 [Labeo rohita]
MHASDELYVLSSGNSGLMDNFQRQQSVWNLVKENVPCSELPEIRAVLGETLIDTYTELYSEVEMWEKIWQTLRCSEKGNRPEAPMFPLADPPAVKELLKAEIQLLLLTLREKAARQGRSGSPPSSVNTAKLLTDLGPQCILCSCQYTSRAEMGVRPLLATKVPQTCKLYPERRKRGRCEQGRAEKKNEEEVMAQYNPSVVNYALDSSNTQRQGSPGSWREIKLLSRPPSSLSETRSRSVSSLSSHSSCEEEIKALRHKLNIKHIDEVVTHLSLFWSSSLLPFGPLSLPYLPSTSSPPGMCIPPPSQEECKQ